MAAAREADKQGLSFCVLEARRRFATIHDFQKGKPIYTYPNDMIPAGDLQVSATVKEELIDELEAQTDDVPVRHAEAHRVDETADGLDVVTSEGDRATWWWPLGAAATSAASTCRGRTRTTCITASTIPPAARGTT
jgi:hypothetical protein